MPSVAHRSYLAYLSLGSNLGDREKFLRDAIMYLARLGKVLAVSHLYETEPVEFLDQPDFLNCATILSTALEPQPLLAALRAIEHALGRPNRDNAGVLADEVPKGPRTIDIDILLFDDWVIEEDSLAVPHPAMQNRHFVLAPLVEIAPAALHPLLKQPVQQLLEALPSGPPVVERLESDAWQALVSSFSHV